jgi:predicted ferric reductase
MTTTTTNSSPYDKSEHGSILRPLFQLRWLLARPAQLRVLGFLPVIPLPYVKHLPYITVGQVMLTLPLAMLFLVGYKYTFIDPDLIQNGYIATYAIIATFLTANKANSIFNFLFGLSFERMVPIHNLASLVTVILSLFHGYVAYVYGGGDSGDSSGGGGSRDRRLSSDGESQFALYGPSPQVWKFMWDGGINTSGSLIIVCLVGLVALSFFRVFRKYCFELWLYSHIFLALGVIIFGFLHSVGILVVALVWWGLDLLLRYAVMTCCRSPSTAATLTKLSEDLVEIRFRKPAGFSYHPGQFVQLSVPDIGPLQFHPITISSAPYEKDVTFHIRALGHWSRRLVELADRKNEARVLLEGPYGNLSMDLENDQRYPVVVCVSGGIGVTPCLSVARQLWHEHSKGHRKLSKLHFVWTVRDLEMVREIAPIEKSSDPNGTSSSAKAQLYGNVESDDTEVPSSESEAWESGIDPVLVSDVYVTQPFDEDLEGLDRTLNVQRGRPDLEGILKSAKAEAIKCGASRVAVVGCGPLRLMEDLKALCSKHSSFALECGGVHIDVHDEIFDF